MIGSPLSNCFGGTYPADSDVRVSFTTSNTWSTGLNAGVQIGPMAFGWHDVWSNTQSHTFLQDVTIHVPPDQQVSILHSISSRTCCLPVNLLNLGCHHCFRGLQCHSREHDCRFNVIFFFPNFPKIYSLILPPKCCIPSLYQSTNRECQIHCASD
jgi:hypothetical protein